MLDTNIELGYRVEDQISGFTGIVTKIGDHISGCTRIGAHPDDTTGNSRGDEEFFFADQLTVLDEETAFTDVASVTTCDFELGQEVRDVVTGFTGTVVIINYSLYNAPQLCVQSHEDADEREWYDDVRLEAISEDSQYTFEGVETAETSTATGPVGADKPTENLSR